jgi:hypothetical protein
VLLDLPRSTTNTLTSLVATPTDGRPYRATAVNVTLQLHMMTKVTVVMALVGSLNTHAVDAATGDPVTAAYCVHVQRPEDGGLSLAGTTGTTAPERVDQRSFCSTGGPLTVGPLRPGPVQLFATVGDGYGAQWVGPNGGTGDRRAATTFDVTGGQSLTIAPLRFARAGTIAGTVRDYAGTPTTTTDTRVCAHPYAIVLAENVATPAQQCADSAGRYTLTGLGPYAWPVQFVSETRLPQMWSGGADNRLDATPVVVSAGATTQADADFLSSSDVHGTVVDAAGQPQVGDFSFIALDAVTGDQVIRRASSSATSVSLTGAPVGRSIRLFYWNQAVPELICAYSVVNRMGIATPVSIRAGDGSQQALQFRYYLGCPPPSAGAKPPINPRNLTP